MSRYKRYARRNLYFCKFHIFNGLTCHLLLSPVAHPLLCTGSMRRYLIARLGSVAAFVLLGATGAQAATLTLAWDANPEPISGYILYWGSQSGQYTQSLDVGKATTRTLSGLASNTSYYF